MINRLVVWLVFLPSFVFGQVTLKIVGQPEKPTLFVAGDFNGWKPNSDSLKFSNNFHFIELLQINSPIECKFTQGSWDRAETTIDGGFKPNRVIQFDPGDTVALSIDDWSNPAAKHSTKTKSVFLFKEELPFPKLDTTRNIWVYLPPTYDESKLKRYPVLYLFDAQNLFDESTAFANEWRIDEIFDSLSNKGIKVPIVVGIENGGSKRNFEYTPWLNENYESGGGKNMAEFIVNDVMPEVKRQLRVKRSRKHTYIGGSSLGGLMSFYTLIEYNHFFSGALVYSPAFWINPEIFDWSTQTPLKKKTKVILISGELEHPMILDGHQKMAKQFKQVGFSQTFESLEPNGKHNEKFWSRILPWSLEKLLCPNCI